MESPVAAHVRGAVGQLEGEGPGVRGQVRVAGCEVDGVGVRLLAHFHLRGEHVRRVVVYIEQVNLESARPTGRGHTCTQAVEIAPDIRDEAN